MSKTKVRTAHESRQAAEDRLATLRATAEAKAMEQTIALLESPQPVQVPWTEYPAFDQFGGWGAYDRPYYWTSIDDRTEGRYRPIYETDQDLRRIRADARRMQTSFPVAEGALESLTNYVILGYQYTAQAKVKGTEDSVKPLVSMVQKVMDKFLDRNNFINNIDRQIFQQSRSDGESFPTVYPDGEDVRLELVSPDYILQPLPDGERDLNRWRKQGHKLNYWWHGVHTQYSPVLKRDDVTRPLGYHAVFDRTGDQWDYLESNRVEHIKCNVGNEGRRGVTDFYIILSDLENEAKLRRNTAIGAAILAAIVEIRQYPPGTSKTTVERMTDDSATSTYQKYTQNGQRSTNNQNVAPGTVRHVPAGQEAMLGAMGTLRSPVYIEVDQFLLRIIGGRWRMPEYLISGDASNSNYASTLVAESPFVRYCESNQWMYGTHFYNIIWKALLLYHRIGAFGAISWKALCDAIDIKVDYKSPASRDQLAQAQTNQIMYDAGVLSKRTWQVDAGMDPDEESKQIAKEPAKPAPVIAAPFGQSGLPGERVSMPRLEAIAAGALKRLTEGK